MAHITSWIRTRSSSTDRSQVFQKSAWEVLPGRSPLWEDEEHSAAMRLETPAHGLPLLASRPGQTVGPPSPPLSAHLTVDLEPQRSDHSQVLTGTESRRNHAGLGTSRTAIRSRGSSNTARTLQDRSLDRNQAEPGRHLEPFTCLARDAPIGATGAGRRRGTSAGRQRSSLHDPSLNVSGRRNRVKIVSSGISSGSHCEEPAIPHGGMLSATRGGLDGWL